MDSQDQSLTQATGHESHGVHLCHKCGWPFPNPHPSAKHRRAHKRICGTIEGYKLVEADGDTTHLHLSHVEHHSDEDRRKTPSPRGLEPSNTQKPSGGVGERLISGDEVFADTVTQFSDGGWNSGVEDNVKDNLGAVTVKDEAAHTCHIEDLGGSAVVVINRLKRMSSESKQMQDPDTPEITSILESNPVMNDHMSSEAVNSMVNVSDYRTEEAGVVLLDSKPDLPSDTDAYPNKVEGLIDVLHEGDAGNIVKNSTFSLLKDDADNIPVREAPINTSLETPKSCVNDVASSDAEPAVDFVPKEENGAEGLLELHQNAHNLDVGPVQHASISANTIQVDLGLHTLHEGEEKDEGACKVSVPGDIFNLANPTILIEDFEDPEGVKSQISLQSRETIRNDEGDLKDVASVESFTVLQSESPSIANEVPPGECYIAYDNATRKNESCKLVVIEKPMEQRIVEPPVEGKINFDQRSDVVEASLIDYGPDISGETGSLSKEQDSSELCEDAFVNPPDFLMPASDVIPAGVVCSVDDDKNTSVDGKRNGVTEESDRAVGISTPQSNSKEPLVQDQLPANIVDGEGNSNYEKLETESHDTIEFHFTEVSMESESHLQETNQRPGLICDDDTHHFDDMKITGVFVNASDKLEADTKIFHNETNTATPLPSESLSQTLDEPLINKAEDYSLDVCKPAELELVSIAEEQSLAGHFGKNTSPLESAGSNEIGGESVMKSQGIQCPQSHAVSGSEKETNEDDINIIDIVRVECESYADTAVDLQTDIMTPDKEIENPISKDNQTEEFRGEAGGLLSASTQDQCGNELAEQQTGVSGIDFSVGICSRSDSLDCNWGSVSVLSLQSDVPALLDAETLPSFDSHASIEGNSNFKSDAAYDFQQSEKSEMHEGKDESKKYAAVSERQTGLNPQHPISNPLPCGWFPFPSLPQAANDSEGRQKNEEIIAKVTNWSTPKQHAPLKSLLSEVAQDTNSKSPTVKENLGLENQKSEKIAKDNGARTKTTVHSILGPESPIAHVAKKEIAQEWNSPARYPSDIQIEKRKVKGRPFWTQFMCCTSVNSQ